jgi:hypothetical protein
MTLLAVWLSIISHRAQQQKLAVEKILGWGGSVIYDYQAIPVTPAERELGLNYNFDEKITPPSPQWLRKFIGDDYFQTVVYVGLSKTSISDEDLIILENLPALKVLALDETKITGKGLTHLEGLKNLSELSLENTLIDDNGLAYLEKFAALRWLGLGGRRITDGSVKYFKNFRKLETLMLTDTQVTEKGEASIKNDLPNTNIIRGASYWD